MGIYIKGMEMPKNGEWVNVNICSDGSVYFVKSASNGFVFYGVRKGEAIEIPPHGRLIDADVLTIILSKVIDINASIEQRNEATDQERRCLWWFEQQIGIAPTIIEAEGGET